MSAGTSTSVLLVEDNPGDARLLAETLSEIPERPFALTTARTLGEALPLAAAFDVLLLDLSLPDSNGLETLERIKGVTRKPVVILTGRVDDELAGRAVHSGAQDYLLKGEITPALVARTLRYAIERQRGEENAQAAREVRRARFLLEVGAEIAASLAPSSIAAKLTAAMIPSLGDICALDLLMPDGQLRRVDGASTEALSQLAQVGRSSSPGEDHPAFEAIRTRRSQVVQPLSEIDLARFSPNEQWRRAARTVQLSALMATPLVGRDGPLGVLTLGRAGASARYGEEERLIAENVAARATVALENAKLYDDARRALRAREEMIAVVSHDLRNPASVMSLSLKLISKGPLHESQAGALKRAQRALGQMTRLLEDLLDLARIDEHTFRVERQRHDISALLADLIEPQLPLAEERRVRIEVSTAGTTWVDVDHARLAQVISNLVGNALKFTPAGGAIRVGLTTTPTHAKLSVCDDGPGIAAADLPFVFDRFWQSPTAPKTGAGLGLAIVKAIVEAHGGTVEVESPPGRGAMFHVHLPRVMDLASEPRAATAS